MKRYRSSSYRYARRANGRRYRVYGGGVPRISGYGAYKGGGSRIMADGPPSVQNSSSGVIISHREYIGDLNTSQAFTNYQFPLNPGMNQTFPWLSEVASNFEEWVPRGIVFQFKSTSSDAVVSTNANAALGTVIMATEYNPYNGAFGNKQQMENYQWAKSCKPSQSMIHGVECKQSKNVLPSYFVRTTNVPSNQDQRLYDMGSFQIAAVGMQSNGGACGELWVSYEIEFRKPRMPVGVDGDDDGNTNMDHIVILSSGVATAGVGIINPFGSSTTVPIYPSQGSSLGGVVTGGAVTAASFAPQPAPTKNNFVGGINVLDGLGKPTGAKGNGVADSYYFPPGVTRGNFMIQYNARYTTGGANWGPSSTLTNCENLELLDGNTEYYMDNTAATTTTDVIWTRFVTVTGANASFMFAGANAGTFATPLFADLFVIQLPLVLN